MLWATDVCSQTAFAQPGPVSSNSLGQFFSVRVSETDPLQAPGFARATSLAMLVPVLGPSPRLCIKPVTGPPPTFPKSLFRNLTQLE